jgi:hypothetical protein
LASGLENIVWQCAGRDMQTSSMRLCVDSGTRRDGRRGDSDREEDAMTEVLERRFAAMGARVKVAGPAPRRAADRRPLGRPR